MKCGVLDFFVCMLSGKVQNFWIEEVVWTLDRQESKQRSKTQRKKSKIGRGERKKVSGGPNCGRRRAGLDVGQAENQAEVQNKKTGGKIPTCLFTYYVIILLCIIRLLLCINIKMSWKTIYHDW